MCDFYHTCVILSTHVWFLAHIYVIFTKHVRFLPKRPTFNSISLRTPSIVKGNKSLNLVWSKWGSQWWGFGKVFNVLQSPIGRMASRPMRNIETFPSQHMYLNLSLVKRKVTEFYHNIDRRSYLVWLELLIFIVFSRQLMVFLLFYWAHHYMACKTI